MTVDRVAELKRLAENTARRVDELREQNDRAQLVALADPRPENLARVLEADRRMRRMLEL